MAWRWCWTTRPPGAPRRPRIRSRSPSRPPPPAAAERTAPVRRPPAPARHQLRLGPITAAPSDDRRRRGARHGPKSRQAGTRSVCRQSASRIPRSRRSETLRAELAGCLCGLPSRSKRRDIGRLPHLVIIGHGDAPESHGTRRVSLSNTVEGLGGFRIPEGMKDPNGPRELRRRGRRARGRDQWGWS